MQFLEGNEGGVKAVNRKTGEEGSSFYPEKATRARALLDFKFLKEAKHEETLHNSLQQLQHLFFTLAYSFPTCMCFIQFPYTFISCSYLCCYKTTNPVVP